MFQLSGNFLIVVTQVGRSVGPPSDDGTVGGSAGRSLGKELGPFVTGLFVPHVFKLTSYRSTATTTCSIPNLLQFWDPIPSFYLVERLECHFIHIRTSWGTSISANTSRVKLLSKSTSTCQDYYSVLRGTLEVCSSEHTLSCSGK